MRELGHRGGKARRKGVAEQPPETERQSLRKFFRDGFDQTIVGPGDCMTPSTYVS